MPYSPILDDGFRNLFRYDIQHHGERYHLFCDAFAQFGVAFPALGALGIGPTSPRATLSTYHLTNPTLELSFEEEGIPVALQRQDMDCLPWLTTEHSFLPVGAGGTNVEAEHVFKDERTILSRFTFKNNTSAIMSLAPCWQGRISSEHELYMLPYFHGAKAEPRTPFLEKTHRGLIGGLRVSRIGDDLPQSAIRLRSVENSLTVSIDDCLAYAFRTPEPLLLAPGASISFSFLLEITFMVEGQSDFQWTASDASSQEVEDFDGLLAFARKRFADAIAINKPPQVSNPAIALKAWRARHGLLRDGMRGMDGEFGDELACLCTADNTDFSCVFFWDTLFSSVAISDFHPRYARGAIQTAFVRMDERDGSSPERKFNYSPKGRMAQQSPQSPIASWAVREYLAKNDDPDFLAKIYPFLVRNHGFWVNFSDSDRDGLAEYRWSGQVCDNSPLWDPYAALDATTGCGWVPPVASVALNSFLFWDANHLAALADQQGLTEDALRHRAHAARLQRNLFHICYLPEEKRFWDYNHHSKQHRRVKTFYMFWPLFAGMEVPEETWRDLIENVLLDPLQFFGEIPFPSVAYDEPQFDSKGYWRGRAWPHISYWLLQTLVRYGYVSEAKKAAARILAVNSRAKGFPENMPALSKDFEANGFSDYNWGCAAFYLIACGEYLQATRLDSVIQNSTVSQKKNE